MKVLSVTADKNRYSRENVCAGINSNCLKFGYEDNLTFSRFYLILRFTLGLCNFNFPQLQSDAQVTGEGAIVQPHL